MANLTLVACPSGHGVWLREEQFEPIVARVTEWRSRRGATPPAPMADPRQRVRLIAQALLSRVCEKCQQPNAAASPLCWACGTHLRPVPSLYTCPSCQTSLDGLKYDGTPLDHCAQCGGLWLNRGELGALLQTDRESLRQLQIRLQPGSPAAAPSTEAPLPCPGCAGTLHTHEYGIGSGILIQSCGTCGGLWLDPAALVPIQQFVQQSESYLAPPSLS